MCVIFAASTDLMSTQHTSRFIGPFLRWLNPAISDETIRTVQFYIRKCAHGTEYALLSFLLWRARRYTRANQNGLWNWSDAKFAIVVSAVYAATDEFHQYFVASRQSSIIDVLIDTSGAVLAMIVLSQLWKWLPRPKQ